VQLLSPITEDNDDTISVYVFGEDEADLENEARANGGYLKYEHVANQYGNGSLKKVRLYANPLMLALHASEVISNVLCARFNTGNRCRLLMNSLFFLFRVTWPIGRRESLFP